MSTPNTDVIRLPSVAGQFYPEDADELNQQLAHMITEAPINDTRAPKILVAPHAGYTYSGPIAATAYKTLSNTAETIKQVVILSPAHRFGFQGIAYSNADAFRTPLGDIAVNKDAISKVSDMPHVQHIEQAFDGEHALEVHLPFLQVMLGQFHIVPFVVGQAIAEDVANLLDALWGGKETLIVISSDLSHFHNYEQAIECDEHTSELIRTCDYEHLTGEDACGVYPLRGTLLLAKERDMHVTTLDTRNSGDTAGSHHRVVGYGAYAFH